jgi:hypothetical protein
VLGYLYFGMFNIPWMLFILWNPMLRILSEEKNMTFRKQPLGFGVAGLSFLKNTASWADNHVPLT